jgi:hypothetical protein
MRKRNLGLSCPDVHRGTRDERISKTFPGDLLFRERKVATSLEVASLAGSNWRFKGGKNK